MCTSLHVHVYMYIYSVFGQSFPCNSAPHLHVHVHVHDQHGVMSCWSGLFNSPLRQGIELRSEGTSGLSCPSPVSLCYLW